MCSSPRRRRIIVRSEGVRGVAKVVLVRVKEKEPAKPEKKNYLQALISLITAIVAVLGIVLSYTTMRTQRDVAFSNRFSNAVSHLRDESLAIRRGALYEFKKLAIDSPDDCEMIRDILATFISETIENTSPQVDRLIKPSRDVFLAAEIITFIGVTYGYYKNTWSALLNGLNGNGLDLAEIYLDRAYLVQANLEGASLRFAHLEEAQCSMAQFKRTNFEGAHLEGAGFFLADLKGANFQQSHLQETSFDKADIRGADLRNAQNLTAAQLLEAIIDDTTLLDPALRDEYDRLKAEQ